MSVERISGMFPPPKKREDIYLSQIEINALEVYHFSNMFFHDIYKMIFNCSDMSDTAIRKAANSLLSRNDAQIYLHDRRVQIERFLAEIKSAGLGIVEASQDDGEDLLDEHGNFKNEVIRKVLMKAAKEATEKGAVDNKVFEMILSQTLKQQNLKTEGQLPIMVLAEQCKTCRYRIHIEENYEDVCQLCKYKIESNESYDHKTQFITQN